MHDLVEDILGWKRFYLSGRLQKPVCTFLSFTSHFFIGKEMFEFGYL